MSDILRNSPTLEFGVCSMREDPEGMWVTYPSHQQALVAAVAQAVQEERERCRRQEVEPLVTICEEQAAAYRAERDGIDKVIAAVRSIQAQSPATPEKPTIQETFDKIREIVGDVYETESEQQAGKEQQ